MEKEKIERINELARKKREIGLTEAEAAEQQLLREEYLAAWRLGAKQSLESIVIVDEAGNRRPLKKKKK